MMIPCHPRSRLRNTIITISDVSSMLTPQSMSARQPFFSARPASEQGTAQGFQKPFSIDSSNPLHLSSPAANQSESMKTAFSVPGPFSSNGASSTPQVKTSGLASASKRKSTHTLTQSTERDRKGSLNPVGFPASFSHNPFSDRTPENDAHISTPETKQGASRKVDDVGSSTKGSAFKQTGPQRVPLEQQFGQYNTSDIDLIAPMAGHEITIDGRLKMSTFGQTKKRNRDEIEEDEDESYWVEKQAKRHKSRHHDISDIQRGYTKSPPFSLRTEKTSSSHAEGDVSRRFPDARGSPGSPRYSGRRTTSPVNERHMPDESPQVEQAALDERRNAFERLLGRDTNAFVQQNMEKYDALVKKWSECSEDEWIAGAEVIAGNFEKIVTYVKNAMVAKINTYANIQADINRHLSDLGARDELLDAARKKLIMESGNALG